MENLDKIIESLWLTDNIHWDLTLYWIALINLVVLMLQPDGAPIMGTMLSIGAIMCAVIDKTYAFGYMFDPGRYTAETYHAKIFIGTYLIRAIMFVGPLAVAGSTEEGKVRGAAILAGISGAIYMFMRWFMDQRDVKTDQITMLDFEILPQVAGMALILAQITLRNRFLPGRVNRHVPVTVLGELAAHEVEV